MVSLANIINRYIVCFQGNGPKVMYLFNQMQPGHKIIWLRGTRDLGQESQNWQQVCRPHGTKYEKVNGFQSIVKEACQAADTCHSGEVGCTSSD